VLAAVRSAAVVGIEACEVTVEVDAAKGLPHWTLVGLAAHAVKESRERVSAALVNAGFVVPPRRYTVNLAPADQRKDGTAFDLPIALGVLVATGQLRPDAVAAALALGELGLDGELRPVRGVLPVARLLAQRPDRPALIVPPANVGEARLVSCVELWTARTLRDLVDALRRTTAERCGRLTADRDAPATAPAPDASLDLVDVAGQDTAKRALEIAAAGGHALLMIGPPGAGKTMLARRLPGILPPLSEPEALEVLAIHSVAGLLPSVANWRVQRPFRAPHHSLSTAALVGGGSVPRPGEVSLAHHGVLFLDELQEMPRSRLDVLRQPMEDGRVLISRAQQSVSFPAQFALVGAMNPCPCGYAGDPHRGCSCSAADIVRHRGRVSGPLADRIDLTVHVPPLALSALSSPGAVSSASVRDRVLRARELQARRFAGLDGVRCNARAAGRWLEANTPLDTSARRALLASAERHGLTARAYHRLIRIARTIADLESADDVRLPHVTEALFYRVHDRLPPAAGAP
jgi:magnesium chelatase family protein